MSRQLQLRRGTTAENNAFTGAVGELTYDTQKKELRVHDGATQGGNKIFDLDYITPNWTSPTGVNKTGFTAPSNGILYVSGHGYNGQSSVSINGTIVWYSGNYGNERLATDCTFPLRTGDTVTFSYFNGQFWSRFYPYKKQ